jgi:hypothetical protein
MAMTDHLEIYQSYTDQELVTEITDLKKQRKGYLSQSAGGKSYSQDLRRIDDMLHACIRVQNERRASAQGRGSFAVVDFSRMS